MTTALNHRLLSRPRPRPASFYFLHSIFPGNRQQLGTKSTYHEEEEKIRKKKSGEGEESTLVLHKSKGQHLLTNARVLDAIVRESAVKPTDTVLEIGPGTGNLTVKLLEVAGRVAAVELDKRMVEILNKRVAQRGLGDKLSVVCQDALKAEFPHFDLVVANIPYKISSPLVTKLVYGANKFRSATLLLQKEFARRLMANAGDSEFNRLAVNVKLVASVEFVMDVSKRDFVPSPKVDSSVVIIRPKDEVPNVNLEEWRAFTRTCFSKKNKTVGAILKQKKKVKELLKLSKTMGCESQFAVKSNVYDCTDDEDEAESDEEDYHSSFSGMEFSLFKDRMIQVLKDNHFEDKRPAKLSIEELLNLLDLLNEAGIYFHGQTMPMNADNADGAYIFQEVVWVEVLS